MTSVEEKSNTEEIDGTIRGHRGPRCSRGDGYSTFYKIYHQDYNIRYSLYDDLIDVNMNEIATKLYFSCNLSKDDILKLTEKAGFKMDPKPFFNLLRMGLRGNKNVRIQFKNHFTLVLTWIQNLMGCEITKTFFLEFTQLPDGDFQRVDEVLHDIHAKMYKEKLRVDMIKDTTDDRIYELEQKIKKLEEKIEQKYAQASINPFREMLGGCLGSNAVRGPRIHIKKPTVKQEEIKNDKQIGPNDQALDTEETGCNTYPIAESFNNPTKRLPSIIRLAGGKYRAIFPSGEYKFNEPLTFKISKENVYSKKLRITAVINIDTKTFLNLWYAEERVRATEEEIKESGYILKLKGVIMFGYILAKWRGQVINQSEIHTTVMLDCDKFNKKDIKFYLPSTIQKYNLLYNSKITVEEV